MKFNESNAIVRGCDLGDTGAAVAKSKIRSFIAGAVRNPTNAWSIGTFGAIGEFMWAPSESVTFAESESKFEIRSERGAMRIALFSEIQTLAYQSLWGDGEAWTSGVAFCLPAVARKDRLGLHRIGVDAHALRPQESNAVLFDLGIGVGHTTMHIRTRDAEILAAAKEMEGEDVLSCNGAAFIELLRLKSPVRVMISPMARIEVYSPIPPEGGHSPVGPHTHLLPRLAALRRTHSANIPIPNSLQPVLTLHPRSPWRRVDGQQDSYDQTAAREFDTIFEEFGDKGAKDVSRSIGLAVLSGQKPHTFPFPTDRRLRIQARVTLRRLAQEREVPDVAEWLAVYD